MHITNPEKRKARKQHRCHWCGEPIFSGELYTRWCCFDNGTAGEVKVHPECDAAWQEAAKDEMHGVYETAIGIHKRGSVEPQ